MMKRLKSRTFLFIAALLIAACVPFTCASCQHQRPPRRRRKRPLRRAPTEAAKAKPTAAAGTFGGAWESVSCDTFNIGPEVAAVADCGYVTVPENRATGSDRKIKLAVVRVKSLEREPRRAARAGHRRPRRRRLGERARRRRPRVPHDLRSHSEGPRLRPLQPARHGTGAAHAGLPCLQRADVRGVDKGDVAGGDRPGNQGCAREMRRGVQGAGRRPGGLQLGRERRRRRRHPPDAGLRQDLLLRRVLRHPVGPVRPAPPPRHPRGASCSTASCR